LKTNQTIHPAKVQEELWGLFRKGNRTAFESIFQSHIRLLYKYGSRFTKNDNVVEDCIQDLFLDLWRRREHLGATDSIKLYLLGSLRRRILRSLKSVHKTVDETDFERYNFNLELNSEEQLIGQENEFQKDQLLKEAMAQLSERQKEVIYLKYFRELSYEEIAAIMKINYQSARNLVHNALKILKKYAAVEKLILFLILNRF
jgi:RNA polymerase sigma factor (sigma-70 family)